MMIYLLDANVLINAKNYYYTMDQVPEYWEWLLHVSKFGKVKIPIEIYEEIVRDNNKQKDELHKWVKDNKEDLILKKQVDIFSVRKVLKEGYGINDNITDDKLDTLGRDPFLIAHAMAENNSCIVTTETSKPKRMQTNRKIPDICVELGIECCGPFEFNRKLGFKTSWKT